MALEPSQGARQRYAEEMPTTAYRHQSRRTRKKRFSRHSWALPVEYLGKRRLSLWAVTDLRRTPSCCQGAHNSLRFSGAQEPRGLLACRDGKLPLLPISSREPRPIQSAWHRPDGSRSGGRVRYTFTEGLFCVTVHSGIHERNVFRRLRPDLQHSCFTPCGYIKSKHKGSVNSASLFQNESFIFLNQGQGSSYFSPLLTLISVKSQIGGHFASEANLTQWIWDWYV